MRHCEASGLVTRDMEIRQQLLWTLTASDIREQKAEAARAVTASERERGRESIHVAREGEKDKSGKVLQLCKKGHCRRDCWHPQKGGKERKGATTTGKCEGGKDNVGNKGDTRNGGTGRKERTRMTHNRSRIFGKTHGKIRGAKITLRKSKSSWSSPLEAQTSVSGSKRRSTQVLEQLLGRGTRAMAQS